MNNRILKVVGWLAALVIVLIVGAAIGGSAVLALTGNDDTASELEAQAQPASTEPSEPGLLISSVLPDTPAVEAGLVRGDILLQVDNVVVNNTPDLSEYLAGLSIGDQVTLLVLHGDDELTLTATLGDREGRPYLGLIPCEGTHANVRIMRRGYRPSIEHFLLGEGTTIISVLPDSPAEQAGLQRGDRIVKLDDQALDDQNNLADLVAQYQPGDEITLTIERANDKDGDNDNDPQIVTVTLGEHPEQAGTAYLGVRFGLGVRETLESGPRFYFKGRGHGGHDGKEDFDFTFPGHMPEGDFQQGAIIHQIVENGPAAAADLKPGDIITAIDGEPVESPKALAETVASHQPGDTMTLTIMGDAEEDKEDEEVLREVQVTLAENPDKPGQAFLGLRLGHFFRIRREGMMDEEIIIDEKVVGSHILKWIDGESHLDPDHLELPEGDRTFSLEKGLYLDLSDLKEGDFTFSLEGMPVGEHDFFLEEHTWPNMIFEDGSL